MSRTNRDEILIRQIAESIELISEYIDGVDIEEFLELTQTQDAVLRRLQIMGEAAKLISDSFKEITPNIPWKNMAGMRDIVIHQYWSVDLRLTWNTISEVLPNLLPLLSEALKKMSD